MKRIGLYLVVAFGVTWIVDLALFFLLPDTLEGTIIYQMVIAATMWLPAAGVLVVRLVTREKPAIHASFKPLFRGNVKNYLLAWLFPIAATLFGGVLFFVLFPEQFTLSNDYLKATLEAQGSLNAPGVPELTDSMLRAILIAQIAFACTLAPIINVAFALGEEIGWRGFLFPELAKRLPRLAALITTGVIWGLWHAPIIIFFGHNYGTGYPGAPWTGILMMCLFCVATGTVLSWLTERSGSILPAALGHGAVNAVAGVVLLFTVVSPDAPMNMLLGPTIAGLIGMLPLLAFALVLMLKKRPEHERTTESSTPPN